MTAIAMAIVLVAISLPPSAIGERFYPITQSAWNTTLIIRAFWLLATCVAIVAGMFR